MLTLDASILIAGRILGVLVFGAAVLAKLRHRAEWVGVVANYRIVPAPLVPEAAWCVVTLETAVVASLGTGIWLQAGAVLTMCLLALFAVSIGINLARGRTEIDCGCFQSALRQPLSTALLARNGILIAAMWPLTYDPPHPIAPIQILDGVGAGVALFVLYQVFGQLLALRGAGENLRKRFT